jgi:peptidoglycan/xylan/chitin deacetylase (PgdA/CDA1 family)
VFRAVAVLSTVSAVGFGVVMGLQQTTMIRTLAHEQTVRVIAARGLDGGVRPIATVISRRDGGLASNGGDGAATVAPSWPPALLNPEAHLRTAWDLALGRPNSREILFTFDDGPNPGTTDRLLPILDRHNVKAVFFVCGWRLETDEEPLRTRARNLLLETFRKGHVIGNHSVSHPNMANLSRQRVEYEVEHNADVIEQIIGQRPHLFRPPYGSYSDEVQRHVHNKGYELSLWSIDSHDWQMVGDAQGVAMNVIRLIGNMAGGTILLHDTHPWSVRAADMVLRWLVTENRERERDHRPTYRIANPAEFIEGSRERLPLIAAARAQQDRHSGHSSHADAAPDATVSNSQTDAAVSVTMDVSARTTQAHPTHAGDGGEAVPTMATPEALTHP